MSVFQSTLVKPEFRLATLAGSCTAWSMEFSLMVKCPATKLSAEETIPSTHSSAKPERENTFLAPSLLTWNQLLSVSKLVREVKLLLKVIKKSELIYCPCVSVGITVGINN